MNILFEDASNLMFGLGIIMSSFMVINVAIGLVDRYLIDREPATKQPPTTNTNHAKNNSCRWCGQALTDGKFCPSCNGPRE